MATGPRWKVFDARGRYQAAAKEIEAAAALVAFYGEGATIRSGRHSKARVVWLEGKSGRAHESYDAVALAAEVYEERLRREARERYARAEAHCNASS